MILAILQARMSSSRLPGKVMKPLCGAPMLVRQLERLARCRRIDRLVVATSDLPDDDPLAALCQAQGVDCFRGSLDDVLDRFARCADRYQPTHVVRLTGDCPLADWDVIDAVIDHHVAGGYDYTTNALQPTYPDGLDVEVFKAEGLLRAAREAKLPSEREHVTPAIYHAVDAKVGHYKQAQDLNHLRWVVDEPADYTLITTIYDTLYPRNPAFTTADVLALLEARPELKTLNTQHIRNEGYAKSLAEDQDYLAKLAHHKESPMSQRYAQSEAMLARAEQVIPLGSQTFSKSKTQYPFGVSPYFIKRAKGSRAWDVDGNEYIDFVNGLCAVTLGYCDPDIDAAVAEQMKDGVIFTLPHPLETEVAERIVAMVPCAEKVRFGKNGSDATSGAIRAARAFTGRDRVAVCGYHGWQDWYIGSTARNLGVPVAVRELTHQFAYNDIQALETVLSARPGEFAAVILEPMNVVEPAPGYLAAVKELAHKHGALLVFDETITGFRYANGGAQAVFGVTPDLATFGKGLANGYPLSAVAGRADVMKMFEDVFYSFTMGGETLSLAAARAALDKYQREPVVDTLAARGRRILENVGGIIRKHDMADVLSLSGHPTWTFLNFKEAGGYTVYQLKTLFLQEIFARGILTLGTHNVSYAHSDADLDRLFNAYDEVFALLRIAIREQRLPAMLRCEALEPLFKVR